MSFEVLMSYWLRKAELEAKLKAHPKNLEALCHHASAARTPHMAADVLGLEPAAE